MLDKIIHFSIYNKALVGFFTLVLVIVGIYSVTQLPIDAVPDITNNQVQVITQAPTLGAQEVEQFITAPIEMAISNISDVIEKRSLSRSGISVITIVFRDKTDIYWARQQISEKLKEAESQIPQGMAKPELAPITTGLGEIYHYVIHAKKEFKNKYTATDLRTMQDWIVRRQLAGTEGVAEVSGWGGFVKQYEIALDISKLNAINITIPEIFSALEENNENTGGSYIEHHGSAYFIRGIGLVKSLSDIEKIIVKRVNGIPIKIKDVAQVQFGSATRFGAITRNGEGEAVAGITLMLKGENFSKVINNVKERMVQIQKSLPEGVVIEPFIDRTELVGRTLHTVEKNLIEGALIVVFILVLLLGNFRAGLIVASVIPLAMLFAITMMNLFGVSGNLMSLGAIDFGLIVDGAVIIVEAVVHRIMNSKRDYAGAAILTNEQMDSEVYEASAKIRSSAAFGEIIILIVYLPILALVGIEGKMFGPMAQTVAFAILGAFILSLTYVPMMSARFLSKKTEHKINISDKIMNFFQRIYSPLLNKLLKWKKLTVTVAFILFGLSLWLFSTMGGEFIPTLEEGDLTVEISMAQGASLTQVVETFTKAEQILKSKFPEIKQIVTRIGSAEIPTDPMPIERGDMMISMKPKEEWTSAESREEMQEAMEEALSSLPGINKEVTQPMQMRFNELMTGIRQDVAIKIFGEDLDILKVKADEVAKLIGKVNGVSQPVLEKVTGLPQIAVEYDRDKIAQYGLSISDVNIILKTAFAGNVAGVVFEGEKRFDMVVRLKQDLRNDITNVENLYVPLPDGGRIPLNQIANIEYKVAQSQISREDGKRRIFVGFNVRDRDVESTVDEIEILLSEKLKLPPGYYVTYGGQFENLREAKERLSIAVPVALLLILLLLYVTFHSMKQSLLIFTAVPLSIIGGVIALWLRDMPFSISAGVGFIALFGVAVLNGIVLIGYFNQLEKEGVEDIIERVKEGTKVRLRPVIMTAAVASLGFLPMALSSSAGAEVQKPLATVVIGGLVSATLLTLLVLPILYILFSKRKNAVIGGGTKLNSMILIAFVCFLPFKNATAQNSQQLSLDECINLALKNNPQVKIASLEVEQSQALRKTAFNIDKTDVYIVQDPTSGGNIDNSWGVNQKFAFPTVYSSQNILLREEAKLSMLTKNITQSILVKDVKLAYYDVLLRKEKLKLLTQQDSMFADFVKKAELRFKTEESSYLEKLASVNKYKEIHLFKQQAEIDVTIANKQLQTLLNVANTVSISDNSIFKITASFTADSAAIKSNPVLGYYNQQISIAGYKAKVEKNRLLPDINFGYNHQFLFKDFNPAGINRNYFPGTRIAGVQLGLSIPLFFNSQRGKIQFAQLERKIAQEKLSQSNIQLQNNYSSQYQEYLKLEQALTYYETGGLNQAEELLKITQLAYSKGEIGYIEYLQNASQSLSTRISYLEMLANYNALIINLQYLTAAK